MTGIKTAEEKKAQGQFGIALAFSLFILIGGMAWTWRIGQESNRTQHQLSHIQEDLDGMKVTLAPGGKRTMKKPTFEPTFTRKMSVRSFRRMTFILPVISLLASGSIVIFETIRRDHLAREFRQAEQEYVRLEAGLARLPHASTMPSHSDDHHDHHDD